MGATTFHTLGTGKSVDEAFKECKEQAQWESGHGGYTGTIAEKPSYFPITLPPRLSLSQFLKLVEDDMALCEDEEEATSYARESLDWAKKIKRGQPGRAERIKEANKQITRTRNEFRAFARRVKPEHRALIRQAATIYQDKWGPCLAIQLKPADERLYESSIKYTLGANGGRKKRGQRFWMFCGWASC